MPLSALSSQVQKDKSTACGFSLESVRFYAVGDFSINLSLMFSAPVSPGQCWDALGCMNVDHLMDGSQTEGCTPLLLKLKMEQDAEALCKEAGLPDASTSCTDT